MRFWSKSHSQTKDGGARDLENGQTPTSFSPGITEAGPSAVDRTNPVENASVFSYLTLTWLTKYVQLGAKRPLEMQDLPYVPTDMKANIVGAILEKEIIRMGTLAELKSDKSVNYGWIFLKALSKCFWKEWTVAGLLLTLYIAGVSISPLVFQALLKILTNPDEYAKDPFFGIQTEAGVVITLALVLFVSLFSSNAGFMMLVSLGTKMRAAVMYVIFRKALRISPTASHASSSGEIVNLMSNDTERVFLSLLTSHMIWVSPVMILIIMILLLIELGTPALAGVAIVLIIMPLQVQLGKAIGRQKRKMLKITDMRVGVTSEALAGINVIKMNAWEPQMSQRVQEAREQEMKLGRNVLFLFTLNTWLLFIAPNLVALAIFTAIELTGLLELDPVLVYTILAMVNTLRMSFMIFPKALAALAQAIVSIDRIGRFLFVFEVDHSTSRITLRGTAKDTRTNQKETPIISISNGSFTWDSKTKSLPTPVLSGVNFECKRGELVAIVGRVGGGKTSLLSAILNEIGKISGTVDVSLRPGKPHSPNHATSFAGENVEELRSGIGYVSQEPWIQNATVRENILFQSAHAVSMLASKDVKNADSANLVEQVDEDLFRLCVRATELLPDIKILPNGVDTEIGDRGVNLSGGQKSRVTIARALYRTLYHELDLVLMDDCFSALDPHVGLKVFQQIVLELLHGKTRIVVLNSQMHLLKKFDRIIGVDNGRILLNEVTEVALRSPILQELIAFHAETKDDDQSASTEESDSLSDSYSSIPADANNVVVVDKVDYKNPDDEERPNSDQRLSSILRPKESEERKASAGRLYREENRKRGRLNVSMYATWLRASVRSALVAPTFILMCALFVGGQAFKVASEYWLGVWTEKNLETNVGLGVFGGLVAVMTLFVFFRGVIFMLVATRSSVSLHNKLIFNILRAPVNLFFDVTPAGQIINRISHDLDKVDQLLPETFYNFLTNIFQVLSAFVLCIWASPYFLLFLIPVLIMFVILGKYFSSTSRELKRMESISRSPLYSNFAETVSGLSTIRAFAIEQEVTSKHEFLVDNNGMAFYLFWMAGRWLALRLDFLISFLQTAAAVLAVLVWDSVDTNAMSLAIIYAIQLTGLLQFTIRLSVETENAFTSVERLSHYATSVPQERAAHLPDSAPNADWPSRGEISFQNVSLRYRPNLDVVLHNVTFDIKAGEKVGICGRSGAGKTTISAALFRLVDPLETGQILIDGVDISTIGLQDLRRQLGIIPQQPVIFSGTLRFNLDPWGRRSDEEILHTLRRVQLGSLADEGLDSILHEKGSNLSVGERQLISIARSVLQGARIIMLDEATANIDSATDTLIQQTIRQEFKTQTLLVIAHRMQTIADSDKILVLSFGRLMEFDSPNALLKNPNSLYSAMVQQSNAAMSE